jgi:hypothetical protein
MRSTIFVKEKQELTEYEFQEANSRGIFFRYPVHMVYDAPCPNHASVSSVRPLAQENLKYETGLMSCVRRAEGIHRATFRFHLQI